MYYLNLLWFFMFKSVMGYCLILIVNSLLIMTFMYSVSVYSWYSMLLYLVYVGGVYILFMFVSVHLPNKISMESLKFNSLLVYYFLFEVFLSKYNMNSELFMDYSFKFCKSLEGYFYLILCCGLLLCFFLVSFLKGSKESFIR